MQARTKKIAIFIAAWIVFIILGNLLFHYVLPVRPVVITSSNMDHQGSFDQWWTNQEDFYLSKGISKAAFLRAPLHNGLPKGSVAWVKQANNVQTLDVILYRPSASYTLLTRVVNVSENKLEAKSDGNPAQLLREEFDERSIPINNIQEMAFFVYPRIIHLLLLHGLYVLLAGLVVAIVVNKK